MRKNIFEMSSSELLNFFYPLKEEMNKATVVNDRINKNTQFINNARNQIGELNGVIEGAKGGYLRYVPKVLNVLKWFVKKPRKNIKYKNEYISVSSDAIIIGVKVLTLLIICCCLIDLSSSSFLGKIQVLTIILLALGMLHLVGYIKYKLDKNKPNIKAIKAKIADLENEINKAEGYIKNDSNERNRILNNIDQELNNELHYSYFSLIAFEGILLNLEKKSSDTLKECLRVIDSDEKFRSMRNTMMEGFEQANRNMNEGFRETNQNINERSNETNKNISEGFAQTNNNINETRNEIYDNLRVVNDNVNNANRNIVNVNGNNSNRTVTVKLRK